MPETDADADITPANIMPTMNLPAPFHDVHAYVALRRQGALALSPDGSRLIAVASELDAKTTGYVSALWEIDTAGDSPAKRLTRSAPGEAAPVVLPDNSVLFVSKRPDPTAATPDEDGPPALWLLPAGPGEARQVATWGGGISGVWTGRDSGDIYVTADAFAGTTSAKEDADKRKARKDKKVSAILHDRYPVRLWDHDLGAEQPRIFAGTWQTGSAEAARTPEGATPEEPEPDAAAQADATLELRDLTGDVARSLADADLDVSRDGRFAAASWARVDGHTDLASGLVCIDLATGQQVVLDAPKRAALELPKVSPDGDNIAYLRTNMGTTDEPHSESLWVVSASGGPPRELPLAGDLRPTDLAWSPDGGTVYFTADEAGRAPVFALDVATGTRRRLACDGAYTQLQVHPDGSTLFAVRSSYTDTGTIVALNVSTTDQQPTELHGPAPQPALPGTLTEVTARADDGTQIRSYLALPDTASTAEPAPLLLWVHGGPVGSWNAWSWRWCPWLMVARGYAVLMPDPALSTGYGDEMLRRGWGRWGDEAYTDVIAATDAVLGERDDLDSSRTAMMGGSFGGYMANWIATHTDRFKAIVSHASLWDLPAFGGTTDAPSFWRDEMSAEMQQRHTPSVSAADIRTPMLVIHGDKDYRVPIGEGLRLWWDLLDHADPTQLLPHRFLYFPNENHWILSPNHAALWYETSLAFLAWHVLGDDFKASEML